MGQRYHGVARLVLGIPMYIVMIVLGPVLFLLTAIVWLVDSLWQAATGSDGISADNPVTRLWKWYAAWHNYVAYGEKNRARRRTERAKRRFKR